MTTDDRDRTEDLLTRSLQHEAADVHPAPGALQTIQRRTSQPKRRSHRWVWAAGAASLATAAVVTGIVLVADDDGGTSSAPIVDQPSEGDLTAIYDVWFYGAQPGNPEGPGPGDPSVFAPLYAEEHIEDVTHGSGPEQAVRTFLTSGPFDPDYSTGWPSGIEVESVATEGGVTTITLTGDADLGSRGDLTSGQAHSAIQAMLRTARATTEAAFVYNGEPLDELFGLSVAPSVEVLPDSGMDALRAPIGLDINEGRTLDNPVSVPVTANVHEGTVNWQLLDDAGAVVDEGFVTAGTMEWAQVSIDLGTLDPGTYVLRAYEVSVADGDENYEDTKTFTVE